MKITNQQFIDSCKEIHADFYDYSETKYIKARDKIKIICPVHGEFFNLHTVINRGKVVRNVGKKES